MRQGRAGRDVREGGKPYTSANGIVVQSVNPGYTNMLGNMVGDHVTGEKGTSTGFTGEKMHRGRGFRAPPAVSQETSNSGSQRRYK